MKKNIRLKNDYSLKERYKIKKSNIFWKAVDELSFMSKRIGRIYEKSISKEYENEIKEFNLKSSKNILHIGCGPYPISAISFSKIKNCKIVAIDKNENAVKKAKKIIDIKNLKERVSIKKGDGIDFSVDKFDTIIVSGCSIPKSKILKNIFENAKSNTRIIVREQGEISKIILKIAEKYEDVKITKKMENNPFPTSSWESFYFLKK